MGSYDRREEKFAGEYPPFCAPPRVSGWIPHAIRSLISLIVASPLGLVVSARYNCNMCHTAQANNVDTQNNRFVSARKKMKK